MIKMSKQKAISRMISFLVMLVLVLGAGISLNGLHVKAAAVTSTYIEDGADVFTDDEEAMLTKEMKAIQKKYDMDVVILTVNGLDGQSALGYIDDYVDAQYNAGLLSKDVVVCIGDIDARWVEITRYGKAEAYITDSRNDSILDDMTSNLQEDKYYDAFSIFLDDIDTYLGKHPNPLTWTWVQALIGLAIGAIITAVMVSNSKGKITTDSRTYLDQANSGLVAKRDMYITTTVHRIRKPKNSSGGGGGGHSPGGLSRSSGGRRF